MNKKKSKKTTGTTKRAKSRQSQPKQDLSTGPRAMRLETSRIHFYERNPRRGKNPEYDRIKASILTSGMDQALSVTQRPNETDYIVQAGGNTRLQILKELYQSTGEQRFLMVDCWFVEWDQESTVLLAHLRENELRGNLTFIDKAQAVLEVRKLIAKEMGVGAISDRELQPILTEHGYSLSHGLISLMDYAVSILAPLLPIALQAGLGKPQLNRIRNLECIGRKVWSLRDAGAEEEFETAFEALCRRHDSIDWQLEPLQQAIENEIAEAADVSIQIIRMEFDCRLAGREPYIPDFVREQADHDEDFPVARRDEAAIESKAERDSRASTSTAEAHVEPGNGMAPDHPLHDQSMTDAHQQLPEVVIELPPEPDNEGLFRRIGVQSNKRIPIELLRETAFTVARRLAERHGIGVLIAPLNDNGLGFLVLDIPPASVVDQLDDELLEQVSSMWWQLVAFAEMALAPPELLQTKLDRESALSSAMLAGEGDRLTDKVCTLDPAQLAMRFWRQLNHEDWCDWLWLTHNYRELHRMARLLNTPLWSSAT